MGALTGPLTYSFVGYNPNVQRKSLGEELAALPDAILPDTRTKPQKQAALVAKTHQGRGVAPWDTRDMGPPSPAPAISALPKPLAVPQSAASKESAPSKSQPPADIQAGNQRYLAQVAANRSALPYGEEAGPMTYIEALGQAMKMMPNAGSFVSAMLIPKWANQIAGNQMQSIRNIEADKRKAQAFERDTEHIGIADRLAKAQTSGLEMKNQLWQQAIEGSDEERARAMELLSPNRANPAAKLLEVEYRALLAERAKTFDEGRKAEIDAQLADIKRGIIEASKPSALPVSQAVESA